MTTFNNRVSLNSNRRILKETGLHTEHGDKIVEIIRCDELENIKRDPNTNKPLVGTQLTAETLNRFAKTSELDSVNTRLPSASANSGQNLNNTLQTGTYRIAVSTTNKPSEMSVGTLQVVVHMAGTNIQGVSQLAIETETNRVWSRCRNSRDSWSEWSEFMQSGGSNQGLIGGSATPLSARLGIFDRRNPAVSQIQTPIQYIDFYGVGTVSELSLHDLNLPSNVSAWWEVKTCIPWGDMSIAPHQTAVSSRAQRVMIRFALSNETWSNWREISLI